MLSMNPVSNPFSNTIWLIGLGTLAKCKTLIKPILITSINCANSNNNTDKTVDDQPPETTGISAHSINY